MHMERYRYIHIPVATGIENSEDHQKLGNV